MRGRAVGAVNDNLQAVESVRQGAQQMTLVQLNCCVVIDNATDIAGHRAIPWLTDPRFDRVFDGVVKFVPTTCEELDAVVWHRIVGGREHHAKISIELIGEVGNCWSRNDSEPSDVDAGTGQARNDCRFEELTADAGIATNDGMRTPTKIRTGFTQHVCCRNPKIQRQFGRQIAVRKSANPVCAEQPTQRLALAVLRSLTSLLETVLLTLLDPWVTSEEAGLLQ